MTYNHDLRRRNLEALLGIAGVGMFTAGPDLKIRSMNQEAERLLGLEPGGGAGLTCREALGPDLCRSGCSLRQTLLDRKARGDWTVNVSTSAGIRRELHLATAFLEGDEEGTEEVAITIRDITPRSHEHDTTGEPVAFHGTICASEGMREIVSLVRELAPYDSTVLILGESGTGKELIARAVHEESGRKAHPFITVNCSAYSEGLLESELFGHVRGAFTGAVQDRRGRFVASDGGTVFLDEIGEIAPSVQVKLLRVLQEHVVERVGDQQPIPVNLRIVAATNRDLRQEVRAGRFREDLFYRLNVITVDLPPLRKRYGDIPVLAQHFAQMFARRTGKQVDAISDDALDALLRHDWPGNVRELENALEHAVVRTRDAIVHRRNLPAEVRGTPSAARSTGSLEDRIDAALAATGGQMSRAAKILGVHRTTVWRHLKNREG